MGLNISLKHNLPNILEGEKFFEVFELWVDLDMVHEDVRSLVKSEVQPETLLKWEYELPRFRQNCWNLRDAKVSKGLGLKNDLRGK